MFSVFDGVVRHQLTEDNHRNRNEIILGFTHGTRRNDKERIVELVKIVIKQLAETAAIVSPARLLPVDRIHRLEPEHAEGIENMR